MNFNRFGKTGTDEDNFRPLDLSKGDILDLTKVAPSLRNVTLGAGWTMAKSGDDNFDLDISAFLLDRDGRVKDPYTQVVYFKQMSQQGIYLEGDNLTGSSEDSNEDDERINVALDDIPAGIQSIVFNVNIFEAMEKRQTFGMIRKSYIRLLDRDNNDRELLRFSLKTDAASATALTFAKLERVNNGWQFHAIGDALTVRDLNQLLVRYMAFK